MDIIHQWMMENEDAEKKGGGGDEHFAMDYYTT
jgi:hypothetical protein